jgi:hypothetical protein
MDVTNPEHTRTERARATIRRRAALRTDGDLLRQCAVTAGIGWAISFVVIGLTYRLQLYGDGAIFSYSVAAQDVWAFHWHNISGRLTAYVLAMLPAEIYGAATDDAQGSILAYGLLFFSAQIVGLIGTYAVDRSRGRVIFSYACASTACLCPLVFGFPTEMWMAHALFWPALALAHYGRGGIAGFIATFSIMLALVFSHAAAIVMAVAIVVTTMLRGRRDPALWRTVAAIFAALAVWIAVKAAYPPDDYFASVLARAARHFFDLTPVENPLLYLLITTLAGYGFLVAVLQNYFPERAHFIAVIITVVALAIYWLGFDQSLHAANRYLMRTVLMLGTLGLGTLAALYALHDDGKIKLRVPLLHDTLTLLARDKMLRAAGGVIVLVTLVHAVETVKFVSAWTDYKAALRTLVNGTAADPKLGDPRFVSALRITPELNRLSWNSTTPYLAVLLAPNFAPARLVIDPAANYYWLTCKTATANEQGSRAIPVEGRRLVRILACQHRPG